MIRIRQLITVNKHFSLPTPDCNLQSKFFQVPMASSSKRLGSTISKKKLLNYHLPDVDSKPHTTCKLQIQIQLLNTTTNGESQQQSNTSRSNHPTNTTKQCLADRPKKCKKQSNPNLHARRRRKTRHSNTLSRKNKTCMTHLHCKHKNSNYEVSRTHRKNKTPRPKKKNRKHGLQKSPTKKKCRNRARRTNPTIGTVSNSNKFIPFMRPSYHPTTSFHLLENLHQPNSLSLSLTSALVPAAMFCDSKRDCGRWIFQDLTV